MEQRFEIDGVKVTLCGDYYRQKVLLPVLLDTLEGIHEVSQVAQVYLFAASLTVEVAGLGWQPPSLSMARDLDALTPNIEQFADAIRDKPALALRWAEEAIALMRPLNDDDVTGVEPPAEGDKKNG